MEMRQALAALTALAQESRLRVFRLLVPAGKDGISAGDIAAELDVPAATLTFHLKELMHGGLIESRREGRSIIYSLRVDGMRELLDFLTHDCCKGRPELCDLAAENFCKTEKRKGVKSPARSK